jgi:hypothetical protein
MHVVTYSAALYSVMLSGHMMTVIVIAAVIEWLLGALWYGLIFRKSWMAMVGFSDTNKPKNGALAVRGAIGLISAGPRMWFDGAGGAESGGRESST